MREIKFRAWSPSLGKWRSDWSISSYEPILDLNAERIDADLILEQYTGLHDKAGREIYEGDVIRGDDFTTVVVWHSRACGFEPLIEAGAIWWSDPEVVGNIHENPELCPT